MAGLAWEEYMLEAVDTPPLSPNEERHLLAVAINDLYKTLDIIVEHAEEFLSSLMAFLQAASRFAASTTICWNIGTRY